MMDNKIKKYGLATLRIKKGIRILHLYGTEEEMAHQHGVLLREDIQKGVICYLARKIENEIKYDSPLKDSPWLQKIGFSYLNFSIFSPLIKHIPSEYKNIMKAISKGADVSLYNFLKASVLPDAMIILSHKGFGRYFLSQLAPHLYGCTSFVAFAGMTSTGELLYGRNLDFPVLNYWDPYSTVIYHYPKNAQKYVSITSAGCHVPGVTGFNESGLMLGLHQLFTMDVSANGLPIVIICSEIIKKARSIDEAIGMVRHMRRAGNWAIVLSSAREKRGVVIETSPTEVYVRESKDGLIAHSNHCFSPRLKKSELFFNLTTSEDNFHRCQRLIDLCQENRGGLDEKKGISILGDHVDRVTHQIKSIGRTISAIYNVQSAFFQPERARFFVSTGLAPSNLSPFLELPWEGDDLNDVERTVSPNEFSETSQAKAMREYARAYHHFSNTKDFNKTKEHLLIALRWDSKEFSYSFALGFIEIKRRNFNQALQAFQKCRELELRFHEKALVGLFLGRTYDLLGKRKLAKKEYEPYVQNKKIDLKLRRAFKKSWKRGYRESDIEKTVFQFIFADFLAY